MKIKRCGLPDNRDLRALNEDGTTRPLTAAEMKKVGLKEPNPLPGSRVAKMLEEESKKKS